MPVFNNLQAAIDELRKDPSRSVHAHVDDLDVELRALSPKEQPEDLRGLVSPPLRVAITSFSPEPFALVRPIEVMVEQVDDSYVASFFDANISASGDNQQEAFDNLRSLILDTYDSLLAEPSERLGPEPRRQLAVLESFLGKS
jgi:hypothetical protein